MGFNIVYFISLLVLQLKSVQPSSQKQVPLSQVPYSEQSSQSTEKHIQVQDHDHRHFITVVHFSVTVDRERLLTGGTVVICPLCFTGAETGDIIT